MTAAGPASPAGGFVRVHLARPASRAPAMRVGLFHGLLETWDIWDLLLPLLPAHAEVYAFGLPWDGRQGQEWARGCEPREWIARAMALMPEPPSVLIAHSFGASALLDHLAMHGVSGIAALVLVSPFYRSAYEDFDWGVISYYLNDFHLILEEGVRVRRGPTGPGPEVLAGMGEKLRDRIGPHGWLRFFDLFASTPGLDTSVLSMPCLVMGGENDFASFPNDCRALAHALPDARVEILAGCGHFVMIEKAEEVSASISGFLRHRRCPQRPGQGGVPDGEACLPLPFSSEGAVF